MTTHLYLHTEWLVLVMMKVKDMNFAVNSDRSKDRTSEKNRIENKFINCISNINKLIGTLNREPRPHPQTES